MPRKETNFTEEISIYHLNFFNAIYASSPLKILRDFLPLFKLLSMYKGVLTNYMPIQSPEICHGNYGRIAKE